MKPESLFRHRSARRCSVTLISGALATAILIVASFVPKNTLGAPQAPTPQTAAPPDGIAPAGTMCSDPFAEGRLQSRAEGRLLSRAEGRLLSRRSIV